MIRETKRKSSQMFEWHYGMNHSIYGTAASVCQKAVIEAIKYRQISREFHLRVWTVNLNYFGRVTPICVSKFTIIGSDNGLSPIRRQAIIWTNAGILLIRTLGTNFSEILIQIRTFSNKKMYLKMSSGKWRPFYLGLNVLRQIWITRLENDIIYQNLTENQVQTFAER